MPRSDAIRLAAAAAACALTAHIFLAATGQGHASVSFGLDHVSHGISAFALVVLVYVASRSLKLAAPFAVLVAVLDEAHLAWLSGRMAGVDDWLADIVGIVLACMVVARTRIPMQPSVTADMLR